ncbi:glutamate synthase 2 [Actinidia rufa]|uniref:Glutamate synthase 2 n=1 Tax=Actinidia rufa TaxID=165716 RepID=A0A7J0EB47_9ERIC|nr:glutamate synthase 2 [Actinidia rufa]
MSLGSISRETHEAVAIAMNRLGGNQIPEMWIQFGIDVVDGYSPTLPHLKGLQNGDTATSTIKQRVKPYKVQPLMHILSTMLDSFGTPTFLVNADLIKIAQGAKPGEGGHLPGEKLLTMWYRAPEVFGDYTLLSSKRVVP